MTEPVYIARCPEHGLHGDRQECFVCGEPCEQVPMIPVESGLTDEMVERAWGHYSHPDEDEPESAEIEALRVAMRAAGPWTGQAELARLRGALAYMADPENWLGDPLDQTSTIHGHFTPYELARDALAAQDETGGSE